VGAGHRAAVIGIALLALGGAGLRLYGTEGPAGEDLEFEAATVKPVAKGNGADRLRLPWANVLTTRPGRILMKHATLADLIGSAYKVLADLVAGPGGITEDLYDLEAKLPAGASSAQAPAMLQALLKERFGLVVHREDRTLRGYSLAVGRGGPKLQPWSAKTAASGPSMKEQVLAEAAENNGRLTLRPSAQMGGLPI
jgi:uncharacterized protein (TIGR03435 family)